MTPGQKLDLLNSNLTNMKRKNLLPQHTMGYWDQTPENLNKLLHATEMQAFKEWSCPICHITVYGPKKLLLEHHKIHSQKRELRENETYQQDYKLY
jgi:hypothetical protein